MNYFITKFAAEYNCGAYGTSTYNNTQVCGTSTSANGGLAYTGTDVLVPLAAGILLVLVAVVLLVRNLRRSKATS